MTGSDRDAGSATPRIELLPESLSAAKTSIQEIPSLPAKGLRAFIWGLQPQPASDKTSLQLRLTTLSGKKMRTIVALVAFLLGISACAADSKPTSVIFIVPCDGGWFFEARPDGSVEGQCGSLFGDSIKLPKGTIDFGELVAFVQTATLKTEGTPAKGLATVCYQDDAASRTLKPLKEDAFLREFFIKHRDDWTAIMGGMPDQHLLKLMLLIHYYKTPIQRPERSAGAASPSTSTPPPGVAHP